MDSPSHDTSKSKNSNMVIIILASISIITILSVGFLYDHQREISGEKITVSFLAQTPRGEMESSLLEMKIDNPHVEELIDSCGSNDMCAMEKLTIMAQEEDQQTVLATVQGYLTSVNSVGIFCHQQGHHMGKFLYGIIGNLPDALAEATITCGGSQVHGVLENYFTSEVFFGKEPDDIAMPKVCAKVGKSSRSLINFDCNHGLGHGLMEAYDNDLFAVLDRCTELETTRARQGCNTGAFMANVMAYRDSVRGNQEDDHPETKNWAFDEDDPNYPCSKVEETVYEDCWLYQTSFLFKEFRYSPEEVFEVCENLANNSAKRICLVGIGREISSGFWRTENWEGLSSMCAKGTNSKSQESCITGSMLGIGDMKTSQAVKFCKGTFDQYKETCFLQLGGFISRLDISKEEIKKECSIVENDKMYELCTRKI